MLHAHQPEIEQFMSALFRYADEGSYVALRAFDQFDRGKRAVLNRGVRIGPDLSTVASQAKIDADTVGNYDFPVVFAPPVATFSNPTRARGEDIACGVAISVDLDDVDPQAAKRRLEVLLGPATITVASGGEWSDPDTGELQPKLHVHWRLSEPTTTASDHSRLRQARYLAAVLVGADKTAASLAHPLRWPGTWNCKTTPKMAMTAGWNLDAEVHLDDALEALEAAVEAAGLEKGGKGARVSGTPQASIALIASAVATLPNTDVHWDDWVRMGMTIWRATGGAPDGLEAWEAWSGKSVKYAPGACEERWAHFGTSPPTKLGAGTIFFLAKREGWQRPGTAQQDPGPPETDPSDPGAEPPDPREEPREWSQIRRREPGKDMEWPDPIDLFASDDLGMPKLSAQHLPAALWPFVIDTAERMGVEPASVALIAIATCSSVINDAWHIQPKRRDWSWTEQPRFWAVIVGDPSILKTPVLSICTKPVVKLELEARRRHGEAMSGYKEALAAFKKDKSGEVPEPKHPKCDRYMVEATTVEALSDILRVDAEAKNVAPASKVLVRQDEMSEFFANLDRYKSGGKGGGDRGAYLRLFNGGPYVVDRVARGNIFVPNWSASFVGGVQPDPIRNIAGEAAEDGLLQRFSYCVPLRQGKGFDRAPDAPAWKRYDELFPRLTALYPSAKIGSDLRSSVVFHADAHQHREDIDALARAVSALPSTSKQMQAALGKWPGLFARLALIFHLINLADEEGQQDTTRSVVPAATAACAAAYMQDILLPHLLRAEAVMYSTKQTGRARDIAGLILAKQFQRITTRDVQRGYPVLRDPSLANEVKVVMDSLVSIGWLEPEVPENPVKPVHSWKVNPKAHEAFADRRVRELANREQAKAEIADDLERYRRMQEAKKERAHAL